MEVSLHPLFFLEQELKIENETIKKLVVVGVTHVQKSYDIDHKLHNDFCSLPLVDIMQFWDDLPDITRVKIITVQSNEIKEVLMKIVKGV